ncbi:MAG: glycosyltransferase family 1 protein [Patescibacteria group bacterium]|jgi:glycosyltransferase involved in cell wall biosynthesis
MIIGIDASKLAFHNKTGVEVATQDLIQAILRNDPINQYWLYSATPLDQNLLWDERIKNIVVPGKRLWTQRYLSQALRKNPPDIFWSPSHMLPNFLPAKSVATVHDIAFKIFPEVYAWKDYWLSNLAVRKAVRRASKLVAVSQQTKKDLKRYFHVPGENIEVVYHALRSDFTQKEFNFSATYPALGKYFLYVGRIELKKNLPNLLRAFAEFSREHTEVQLVLVGKPGYGYIKIKKLIKSLHLEHQVICLNFMATDHLPSLYAHALGVALVSRYEGFGLPILEGWASQVPVLTSNTGATAEIAEKAALLVDPQNIKAIRQGLADLYIDTDLRQALIAKGKLRLAEFNWDKSAQKMIELWNKL